MGQMAAAHSGVCVRLVEPAQEVPSRRHRRDSLQPASPHRPWDNQRTWEDFGLAHEPVGTMTAR